MRSSLSRAKSALTPTKRIKMGPPLPPFELAGLPSTQLESVTTLSVACTPIEEELSSQSFRRSSPPRIDPDTRSRLKLEVLERDLRALINDEGCVDEDLPLTDEVGPFTAGTQGREAAALSFIDARRNENCLPHTRAPALV